MVSWFEDSNPQKARPQLMLLAVDQFFFVLMRVTRYVHVRTGEKKSPL